MIIITQYTSLEVDEETTLNIPWVRATCDVHDTGYIMPIVLPIDKAFVSSMVKHNIGCDCEDTRFVL